MGSRSRNQTSRKSTTKKLQEIYDRLESTEISLFHSAIRTESMMNILLEKNIFTQEELEAKITELFFISQDIFPEELQAFPLDPEEISTEIGVKEEEEEVVEKSSESEDSKPSLTIEVKEQPAS